VTLARRTFLGGAAAAVAGSAVLPSPASAQDAVAFLHGVASGDPLPDRVVLWTRVTSTRDVPVTWLVAKDPQLQQVVVRGSTRAVAARDRTVKVDAGGLSPYTTYFYGFEAQGRRSPVGRTRTAPAPGQQLDRLRFAVATCAKYDSGYFNAYARIAEADVDAVLHCGDYIYEGGQDADAAPGRLTSPETEVRTLAEYRQRHAHYKTDPDLQRMHAAHPMVATWDDHESSNDSWVDGAGNHDAETEGPWPTRKAVSQQAYDEWMPVRLPVPGDASRIYRRIGYGALVDVVVIDTRM
jgi:alkaline phosphatase D